MGNEEIFLDLPTEDAVVAGVKKEGSYMSKIRHWENADSSLTWTLHLKQPGNLQLYSHHSCAPNFEGSSFQISANNQTLPHTIQSTGSWNSYKKFSLGSLKFTKAGTYQIKLKPKKLKSSEMMHFDKLTLSGKALENASRNGYSLPAVKRKSIPQVSDQKIKHNTLSEFEKESGWQLLFDGKSLNGWTGYRQQETPKRWSVKNGELTYTPNESLTGGHIITANQYKDFEFSCEWKIAAGGDSGIFLRFNESKHHPYEQFPEYQLLDNSSRSNTLKPTRAAGACYDIYPSDLAAYRGPDKWNTTKIIINGSKVEFFLNHKRTAHFSLLSLNYKKLVNQSKFHRWADFGKLSSGHIGFQDYYSKISFRNIKVKPLKAQKQK